MDYINIGSTPCEETCEQVGTPSYNPSRARLECTVYKEMLERMFPPPEGGCLRVKGFPHDFGTYHEVVAVFSDSESQQWAYKIERESPSHWDEIALEKLNPPKVDQKKLELDHANSLSIVEIEDMVMGNMDCECADGCEVEPDGKCPHGFRSPLLVLGIM